PYEVPLVPAVDPADVTPGDPPPKKDDPPPPPNDPMPTTAMPGPPGVPVVLKSPLDPAPPAVPELNPPAFAAAPLPPAPPVADKRAPKVTDPPAAPGLFPADPPPPPELIVTA